MKKFTRIALATIFVIALVALAAFTPPSPVNAATQPTRTPRSGQQVNQELAFTLQREENALNRQQLHLNQAGQVATKTQDLIQKAQAKGLDVTALSAALATFNGQIAAAKTSHDQAAGILSAKAGFDASGSVTDAQTAHQTLLSARNAIREAHLTLVNATTSLRLALQTWRTQNGVK